MKRRPRLNEAQRQTIIVKTKATAVRKKVEDAADDSTLSAAKPPIEKTRQKN